MGAFALALACNAVRPLYAPGPAAVASFFAGWLVSELALPTVIAEALVVGLLARAGALSAPAGWVGLALSLVAWGVLVFVAVRSLGAHDAVEQAIGEVLGDEYPGALPAALLPAATRALGRRQWHPFHLHRRVRCERDVVYFEDDRLRLRLDVRFREDRPANAPVLVYVHGGAWVLGSKEQQGLPLMKRLAAHGWVCFAINYRLSPRATWPDHLVDVKRALAWVKANAARWGGDPSFVLVSGNSAGGHLASLAALTAGDASLQPGFEDADTSVAGCLSFYGVYDFTDRFGHWPNPGLGGILKRHVIKARRSEKPKVYAAASPICRVHPGAPPFLVVHGTLDSLVPVNEARRFVEELRAVSRAPVVYAEIAGAQHAFEVFHSMRADLVLAGVHRFAQVLHRRHRPEPPAA